MPWKQQTVKELRLKLIKRYGEGILRDFAKVKTGKMKLSKIGQKYDFHQSYPGQLYKKLYPGEKQSKHRDNKDYLHHKLDGCNRGKVEGFKKYFNQNQYLFKDIFGADYSDQTAEREFRGIGL